MANNYNYDSQVIVRYQLLHAFIPPLLTLHWVGLELASLTATFLYESLVAGAVPGQCQAVEQRIQQPRQGRGDVGVHQGRLAYLDACLL